MVANSKWTQCVTNSLPLISQLTCWPTTSGHSVQLIPFLLYHSSHGGQQQVDIVCSQFPSSYITAHMVANNKWTQYVANSLPLISQLTWWPTTSGHSVQPIPFLLYHSSHGGQQQVDTVCSQFPSSYITAHMVANNKWTQCAANSLPRISQHTWWPTTSGHSVQPIPFLLYHSSHGGQQQVDTVCSQFPSSYITAHMVANNKWTQCVANSLPLISQLTWWPTTSGHSVQPIPFLLYHSSHGGQQQVDTVCSQFPSFYITAHMVDNNKWTQCEVNSLPLISQLTWWPTTSGHSVQPIPYLLYHSSHGGQQQVDTVCSQFPSSNITAHMVAKSKWTQCVVNSLPLISQPTCWPTTSGQSVQLIPFLLYDSSHGGQQQVDTVCSQFPSSYITAHMVANSKWTQCVVNSLPLISQLTRWPTTSGHSVQLIPFLLYHSSHVGQQQVDTVCSQFPSSYITAHMVANNKQTQCVAYSLPLISQLTWWPTTSGHSVQPIPFLLYHSSHGSQQQVDTVCSLFPSSYITAHMVANNKWTQCAANSLPLISQLTWWPTTSGHSVQSIPFLLYHSSHGGQQQVDTVCSQFPSSYITAHMVANSKWTQCVVNSLPLISQHTCWPTTSKHSVQLIPFLLYHSSHIGQQQVDTVCSQFPSSYITAHMVANNKWTQCVVNSLPLISQLTWWPTTSGHSVQPIPILLYHSSHGGQQQVDTVCSQFPSSYIIAHMVANNKWTQSVANSLPFISQLTWWPTTSGHSVQSIPFLLYHSSHGGQQQVDTVCTQFPSSYITAHMVANSKWTQCVTNSLPLISQLTWWPTTSGHSVHPIPFLLYHSSHGGQQQVDTVCTQFPSSYITAHMVANSKWTQCAPNSLPPISQLTWWPTASGHSV